MCTLERFCYVVPLKYNRKWRKKTYLFLKKNVDYSHYTVCLKNTSSFWGGGGHWGIASQSCCEWPPWPWGSVRCMHRRKSEADHGGGQTGFFPVHHAASLSRKSGKSWWAGEGGGGVADLNFFFVQTQSRGTHHTSPTSLTSKTTKTKTHTARELTWKKGPHLSE